MNLSVKAVALCASLTSVMLPHSGFAAEIASDINVTRSYNLPHFMIGGSLGSASHSDPNESATAYSLFGGLTVVPALSLEAGIQNFGEVGEKPNKIKVTATTLTAKGTKKLSTQFGFYGKLGMAFWNYDIDKVGDDSGADMIWGLGMEWRITAGLFARMGMDFYTMSPKIKGLEGTDDIDVFSFSAVYGF